MRGIAERAAQLLRPCRAGWVEGGSGAPGVTSAWRMRIVVAGIGSFLGGRGGGVRGTLRADQHGERAGRFTERPAPFSPV